MLVPSHDREVLYATTATQFAVAMPITSEEGWLVNDQGYLLVND